MIDQETRGGGGRVSTEATGPAMMDPDEMGVWHGLEAEVSAEVNIWIAAEMERRHGLIHVGGGQWVIVVDGWSPDAKQVDGLPEWDGEHPVDFDRLCSHPGEFLTDSLMERIDRAAWAAVGVPCEWRER